MPSFDCPPTWNEARKMYPNGYEGGYGQYVLHKRSRNKKKLSDLGLDNMVEKAKKVNAKQKQVNKKGGKKNIGRIVALHQVRNQVMMTPARKKRQKGNRITRNRRSN